jgi:hypothetical protein
VRLAPIESKPLQSSGYSDIPEPKKPKRLLRNFAVAALLVFVVLLVIAHFGSSTTSPEANDQGSVSPTLPATESSFIQAVVRAREDSQTAANDMQKGGIKAIRDRTLCNTLTSLAVSDWVGTVKTVDSNSDGKGVLAIEIAPDVLVKTWNNDLSDIGSNTLIEPGTAVFTAASAMKSGQLVSFSGNFLSGVSGDCVSESSLTLDGKLQSPEFIFQFASVTNYDPSQQASTVPATSKPTADTPMPATIEPDEPQQQQPAPIEREAEATADTTVGRTLNDQEAQEPISLVKRSWRAKPEHDPPSGMWWVVQLSSHASNWDYVQVRYQDSMVDPICEWTVGTWKGQGRSLYTFAQVNAAARAEFESVPADGSQVPSAQ